MISESQKRAYEKYKTTDKFKNILASDKYKENNRKKALEYYYNNKDRLTEKRRLIKEEQEIYRIMIADEYIETRGRKKKQCICENCGCHGK